jgi:hypothetical protein
VRAQVRRQAPTAEDELGAFEPLVQHPPGRFGEVTLLKQLVVMLDGLLQHEFAATRLPLNLIRLRKRYVPQD